jgi:hypothetical protein
MTGGIAAKAGSVLIFAVVWLAIHALSIDEFEMWGPRSARAGVSITLRLANPVYANTDCTGEPTQQMRATEC